MQQHLLLVDDDKDEAMIFEEALSKLPFKHNIVCNYAFSGEQALEILEFTKPDYIFVDLNMPKMNGIDFLFMLKGKVDSGYTKIYLRSTTIAEETARLAKFAGAAGCIKKANSIQEVTNELSAVLANSNMA